MENTFQAMQTALRVLAAYCDRKAPTPEDVEDLRRIAAAPPERPVDELACSVIRQALAQRDRLQVLWDCEIGRRG